MIVIDGLCNGARNYWEELDLESFDRPMATLADYYLKRFPCPRMSPSDRRFDLSLELANEFDVDGVITSIIRYCAIHIYDEPRLKDRLKQRDIPSLVLDREYGMGITGQVKTRVQAFIEMLMEGGGSAE